LIFSATFGEAEKIKVVVSIVFSGGFRRRFLLLFSEKRRVGISVVFGSFSEKEHLATGHWTDTRKLYKYV
jgi:hypothetical protein